ncbi:SEM4F protein, partial [Polyodon spathula]|nr:SEM4F protein [Polyodon spathula]
MTARYTESSPTYSTPAGDVTTQSPGGRSWAVGRTKKGGAMLFTLICLITNARPSFKPEPRITVTYEEEGYFLAPQYFSHTAVLGETKGFTCQSGRKSSAPSSGSAPADVTVALPESRGNRELVLELWGHTEGCLHICVLLLHPTSGVLYVGAKDAIFSLQTKTLTEEPRVIYWNVSDSNHESCKNKGKREAECHNYIRLLQFLNETHIYACGTYAFDPQCAYISLPDFTLERLENKELRMESGRGKCPFEPSHHYTAVMADGVLYAATVNNFLGTESLISRATGKEGERIRTQTSVSWLSEPEFVSSAFVPESQDSSEGDDDKIYFFFTELAREYEFYTKVKVPRVARVCKGDVGGLKTLQKRWTTFLKAQLVCENPLTGARYNILRDMFTLQRDPGSRSSTRFYGLFTSQW